MIGKCLENRRAVGAFGRVANEPHRLKIAVDNLYCLRPARAYNLSVAATINASGPYPCESQRRLCPLLARPSVKHPARDEMAVFPCRKA